MTPTLAVIGGTGIYDFPGLENIEELDITTPFGALSGPIRKGILDDTTVYFLPRHGVDHLLLPHEINYRAHIYALKSCGVTHIISICAVGSLQENIAPGECVVIDQFFDRSYKNRIDTFFGNGCVAHVTFADPVCPNLRNTLIDACHSVTIPVHETGTYVSMEGPAFSTRAESIFYKDVIGAHVIGMTNMIEAKLAREAEMCYATLATVTDYDAWRSDEEGVAVTDIMAVIAQNTEKTRSLLTHCITSAQLEMECTCQNALESALITKPDKIPFETQKLLFPLIKKYI